MQAGLYEDASAKLIASRACTPPLPRPPPGSRLSLSTVAMRQRIPFALGESRETGNDDGICVAGRGEPEKGEGRICTPYEGLERSAAESVSATRYRSRRCPSSTSAASWSVMSVTLGWTREACLSTGTSWVVKMALGPSTSAIGVDGQLSRAIANIPSPTVFLRSCSQMQPSNHAD